MNKSFLPFGLVAALACLFIAFAPQPVVAQGHGDDETELAGYFKEINKAYRKLRVTVKKEDRNAESLEKIRAVQVASLKCKAEIPHYAAQIPEADRKKFVAGFQIEVAKMTKAALDIEIAILEGRNKDAQALVKEMYTMKKPAHETYRAPKKKG